VWPAQLGGSGGRDQKKGGVPKKKGKKHSEGDGSKKTFLSARLHKEKASKEKEYPRQRSTRGKSSCGEELQPEVRLEPNPGREPTGKEEKLQ